VGCKGRRGRARGPVNTGAPVYPHDAGFPFARNRVFHGAQGVQSSHVTHIDLTIPVGRNARLARRWTSELLLSTNRIFFPTRCRREFSRGVIADEGTTQRDQVHIRGEQKSRNVVKGNQPRSINGQAPRAKLAFDARPSLRWHSTRIEGFN
jgi:hypothetical protein